MGTGHSADSPIRVAPLGISSVISLVDDILLEKIREHYSRQFNLPYERIPKGAEDGRARRITRYLDIVRHIVDLKFKELQHLPFFESNDKRKYFDLLPSESILKQRYEMLVRMAAGVERDNLAAELASQMTPGSIDVNIMVKLDRINFGKDGLPLSDEYTDAKAALRGYALSSLQSSLVLSAGINQSLFSYIPQFRDFYRNELGEIKKRIILKVSDFRSAMVQAKILAKKGLEISEFRIESGLNCGGHAFASNGYLLPSILREFKEKRDQLIEETRPLILNYYESMGWQYPASTGADRPLLTVQGGIGTYGEAERLRQEFGVDRTGWASPFLLVPEATCVDDTTRELLRRAREEDLYLSDVSPLGVPFNNIRMSGSEISKQSRVEKGTPGSGCPKGFLASNTDFTEQPICLASREYQMRMLEDIALRNVSEKERDELRGAITEKSCICDHLGNGALIALGIEKEHNAPQAICPGPNIAWFDRIYSLKEMIDHIYGRGLSLVPRHRPHMFANEVVIYVDYFDALVRRCGGTSKEIRKLSEFCTNLRDGMKYCIELAEGKAYVGEDLESLARCVREQSNRLNDIFSSLLMIANPSETPASA